ncbi:MAG: VOC family protein [Deltaproteobacteria bacterium]|nr:VOC family protein [Deltaproteobacteria bacterium]
MQLAHIYLNFPGNTAEAFRYYEGVFGTRIAMLTTFGDATFLPNVPDAIKGKIMHAQLPLTETVHLMGSDAVPGFGPPVQFGDHVHISVVASDKSEADRVFAALGEGGQVTMPIANAPWGAYFGMCKDRFGVGWMVSLPGPAQVSQSEATAA